MTHNLEFLQVFGSRQEAVDHLKKDAESHVNKFRGIVRWVTKKKDLNNLPDGYYLKLSQRSANRVVVYEKKTLVKRGYIYNTETKLINKVYVYSVVELPHEPITSRFNLSPMILNSTLHSRPIDEINMRKKELETPMVGNIDAHLDELKACLKTRRIKLGHRNPHLLDIDNN